MYLKKFNTVQHRCVVTAAASATVMLLIVGRPAAADFAPPVAFHSLVQEDQDVKIRIEVPVERTQAKEHSIVRSQNGVDTVVVADVSLTKADAEGVEASCRGFSFSATIDTADFCELVPDACLICDEPTNEICIGANCDDCKRVGDYFFPDSMTGFCDDYPDFRLDCNGNGERDCCGTCDGQIFDFWDTCVPPGTAEYTLKNSSGIMDTDVIEVIDAHDESCAEELDTESLDTESLDTESPDTNNQPGSTDEPASNGAEASGCSAAVPGRMQLLSPWRFTALMLDI